MVAPVKKEWRITKLLRLGVFCGAVSAVLGLVAARSVYGDVRVSALAVGHELGKLDDVGTGRPLRINGEAIFVASTTEDAPLDAVLDRAEAGCAERSAGVSAELDALPAAIREQIPPGARASGVLRERRADQGVVACLVREDGRVSAGMKETVARLAALVSTGDLSRVGELRYLFAETTATGRTHVVAAWTNGPFNLYAMLPERGHDAPGSDPPLAPRPPRAQRILTADVEGVPYGVRLYDSAAPPAEVIAHYDAEMAARGWDRSVTRPVEGEDQRAYARPGADLLVITQKDEGRTIVSLIEMRAK
jgi:hypothetical protein